jgi:DNA-binding beta-propeller fold protein YncE
VSFVGVVCLLAAAVGNFANAATSGTPGSLAILAGLNRSVLPGPANATPVAARGVAVDSGGNLYIADPLNDVIEKVTPGGTLSIVAGTGKIGTPTPGPATSSNLNHPDGVAVDSTTGDIYIADTNNSEVEKVTAATGALSIIAGDGTSGTPTPGGPATSSKLSFPGGVAVDGSGNVYIADTTNQVVEQVSSATGDLSIIAGTGTAGTPTPGGPATSSALDNPFAVAVDGSGNVFIADFTNNVVEEVTSGAPGTLSIIAGTGTAGTPTPGPATSSPLSSPAGVAVDGSGNVYIADRGNQVTEKVTSGAPGTLSIIAGTPGTAGSPTPGTATSSNLDDPTQVAVDSSGTSVYVADGTVGIVAKIASGNLSVAAGLIDYGSPTPGPGTSSALKTPSGTAADASGNVYIADASNNVVEKLTPGGTLSIFAGSPIHIGLPTPGPATSSNLDHPEGVAVDSAGNVYIADTTNSLIDKVTPSGTLSIFAGKRGSIGAPTPGPATSSDLNHPGGVAVDGSGNVYIADTTNNVVEKVTPSGTLSILVGSGLSSPEGVAADGSGNVYVADTGNNKVEKMTAGGTLSAIAGTGTSGAPTQGPATSSNLAAPTGVAVDSSGDVFIADRGNQRVEKVTAAGTLSFVTGTGNAGPPTPGPATSSALSNPTGVGLDRYGNLYIADQANSDVEEVFGVTSVQVDSTATAMSCTPGAVKIGAATTCTATVSDTAPGPLTPTGTVNFASSPSSGTFSGSGACQLAATVTNGVASCQVSFTPSAAGSHTVTASYGGDTLHQASAQSATVNEATTSTTTPPKKKGRASISRVHVSGTVVSFRVTCKGGTSCSLRYKLTVRETLKHGKVIAVAARTKLTKRTVTVGSGSVVVGAGRSKTVKVSLNRQGRALLARHSPLKVKLTITQSGRKIKSSTLTFRAKHKHKK